MLSKLLFQGIAILVFDRFRDENTRALQEIDGKHEEASKLGGNTDVTIPNKYYSKKNTI